MLSPQDALSPQDVVNYAIDHQRAVINTMVGAFDGCQRLVRQGRVRPDITDLRGTIPAKVLLRQTSKFP